MTRYTPRESEGQQREIDQQRALIRHLRAEGIAAAARVVSMKSDLEAAVKLVLDQGLATGHADTFEDLMREVLVEFAAVKADRDEWQAAVQSMHKGWCDENQA